MYEWIEQHEVKIDFEQTDAIIQSNTFHQKLTFSLEVKVC